MASFVATYQASGGKARQVRVEATDLLDAKRQLRRRGIDLDDAIGIIDAIAQTDRPLGSLPLRSPKAQ